MSDAARQLLKEALKLSPQDRASVANEILLSLHAPETDIDRTWADEAEARLAAYERGEVAAVPVTEVINKYRSA